MADIDYSKIEEIAKRAAKEAPVERMSQIAKEASKEAVSEMLMVCGIDIANPREMQEIMAYGRKCKEAQAETVQLLDYVRKERDAKKSFWHGAASHFGAVFASCLILGIYIMFGGE